MKQSFLYLASYYLAYLELTLVVVLTLALTLSAALARWRRAREERWRDAGRQVIARAIAEGAVAGADVATVAALPWTVQQELVHEFGGSLTGGARDRLRMLGMSAGVARRAEAMCASPWWWRRLAGARVCTALDHDGVGMRALLHDRSGTVRAQAYVWAAGRVDDAVIDALVAALADPERLCRFTVQDSLLRLGRPAARALRQFLSDPARPGLADGLVVARGLAQPELLDPAIALTQHPDEAVRARAAGVLGALGGEAAEAALSCQLQDAVPAVRAAAARALGDVGAWTACSSLRRLMGDTSWPVRRESALALRRMGGAGLLTLRRALRDDNPFVVDMSRQVLDMPEAVCQRVTA
jgi:HEAT repeats